jgi:hypothetical protein
LLNGSSTLVGPVFLQQFNYVNTMLNMMLASNLYAIINKQIIALVILMIGFMISETAVATAEEKQMDESFIQSNFTDRNNIGVTWLETNKTKPDNAQYSVLAMKIFGWFLNHFLNNQLMDLQFHPNKLQS